MPQAIDRLLATPKIRPRFPRNSPADSGISSSFSRPLTGRLLWHRPAGPCNPRGRAPSSRRWPSEARSGGVRERSGKEESAPPCPPRRPGGMSGNSGRWNLLAAAARVVGLLVSPHLHQLVELAV